MKRLRKRESHDAVNKQTLSTQQLAVPQLVSFDKGRGLKTVRLARHVTPMITSPLLVLC
jgi:hypothetical protein